MLKRRLLLRQYTCYWTGRPYSSAHKATTARSRFKSLLDRLPPSLQSRTKALEDAPLSHICSFLILHEITAVVPVLAFAGLFHWLGMSILPEAVTKNEYLDVGIAKFENYFSRKGWFGFQKDSARIAACETSQVASTADQQKTFQIEENSARSFGGRLVLEFATAYAITKLLLPIRIMLSLWATPWFVRSFIRNFGGLGAGTSKKRRLKQF